MLFPHNRIVRVLVVLQSLLFVLQIHSAEARWIDDPSVASAQENLMEWEARFVNAVQKPEIEYIKKPKKPGPPKPEPEKPKKPEEPKKPVYWAIQGQSTEEPDKKPAEEYEMVRVRNFMRYLAKVGYCEQQMNHYQSEYKKAIEEASKRDPEYEAPVRESDPELDKARKIWSDILNEVGGKTVTEAADIYAGQEDMLKGLTVYHRK